MVTFGPPVCDLTPSIILWLVTKTFHYDPRGEISVYLFTCCEWGSERNEVVHEEEQSEEPSGVKR